LTTGAGLDRSASVFSYQAMTREPSAEIQDRVARLLGWTPGAWRPVQGGYTPARRYVAERGAERVFVKVASTPLTAAMLRREGRAYGCVRGDFRPRQIGWDDHPAEPLLIIEDLSGAGWPPPWDAATVEAVLAKIEAMHASKADLPPYAEVHAGREPGWAAVANAPTAFLSLGLVTRNWLTRALPALIEAAANCETAGDAVTHWDLRSDNICLRPAGGAVFIDWAEACLSNPRLDLGFWLPSLQHEGGPAPNDILPGAPEVAAWVPGFFAARAGLPDIPGAPFVRRVQREQLRTALPWSIHALGLRRP
jgi:Phosphotransferase enzyme family